MFVGGNEKNVGGGGGRVTHEELIPAAITDTGCERDLNEDRYAVIESRSGLCWIVCDGMGGVTGGELAAQIAIDALRRDLENMPARPTDIALKAAILEANRMIVLRRQNPMFSSMGTTVVAALFQGQEVSIGHVGDSRAYLIRQGAIQPLTTDHTYVQQLVERGQIKPEEALSHPQAHILTKAIGSEPGLEVDLKKFWIWEQSKTQAVDILVLCSDGLYSHISEHELAQTVSHNSPQAACARLVELAKERGGFDNITIAVIPLGGQIRAEAPPGYQSKIRTSAGNSVNTSTRTAQVQLPSIHVGRLVASWIILSVVSIAIMIIITTFFYSQFL